MEKYLVPANPKDSHRTDGTPRIKRIRDDSTSSLDSSKKARTENAATEAVLNSNYYSPLTNDNGDTLAPTLKTKRAKEPRLPPIILHQELSNPKATYEKIQSWATKPVYFKQIGKVRHIYATHKDDFVKIKEQLKLINFLWTSHNAQDNVHKKLILRGIDKSYSEGDVFDDLNKQFDTVVSVKQLTKKSEDGEHISLGVYLVYFKWDTILSIPMKMIKYCCFHKISWSHFRTLKANKIKQCFNCQGFGHHSSNCGLKNRCVKCVASHSPGKCNKIKGADAAECCNCGGSHPANYKGCVKAKEYQQNMKKPLKSARKEKHQEVNGIGFKSTVNRKLTFSDEVQGPRRGTTPKQRRPVISGSRTTESDHHLRGPIGVSNSYSSYSGDSSGTQGFSFISDEINSLFGIPFTELMDTVRSFIPIYKRCENIAQRNPGKAVQYV